MFTFFAPFFRRPVALTIPRGGSFRAFVLGAFAGCVSAAVAAPAVPTIEEIAERFQPFRIEQASLSPDGRHVAYSRREGTRLFLAIVEVDRPESRKTIPVGEDDTADQIQRGFKTPARLLALAWASPERLVYSVSLPGEGRRGEQVRAVDVDGRNDRKLADGVDLNGQPHLLGFRLGDPNVVAVESIGDRRRPLAPAPGESQVRAANPDADAGIDLFADLAEMHNDVRERLGTGEAPQRTLAEERADLTNDANERSTLFRIELGTGKNRALSAERNEGRFLYDQQAKARVWETAPFAVHDPVDFKRAARSNAANGLTGVDLSVLKLNQRVVFQDQVFRIRPPAGGRWQELDRYLAPGEALVFRTSRDAFYGQRSFPLAFDADGNLLYFASNVGRDTYGLYALDLQAKKRTTFAVEDPHADLVDPGDTLAEAPVIFDRHRKFVGVRLPGTQPKTRWFDAELARLQTTLETKFPRRDVTLVGWDDSRKRVLALVNTLSDPGRYFVFDDGQPGRLREVLRRGPGVPAEQLNDTKPFAFDTPAGIRLTGTIALPATPHITPSPLVLVCRDIPDRRPVPEFDVELQALADLGFIVATVRYRGTAGHGAKHRDSVREGFDTLPVEDLRAAVAWIASKHPVDAKRVAVVGQDFGGYVALRAAQLHPTEFRCVVALNAPMTPLDWARGNPDIDTAPTPAARLREQFFDPTIVKRLAAPPLAETLSVPTLLVQDENKRDYAADPGKSLHAALRRRSIPTEYVAASRGFTRGEPLARAEAFVKVAEFLNVHIYDFKVDIGEARTVK